MVNIQLVEEWWDRYGDKTKKNKINEIINAINNLKITDIITIDSDIIPSTSGINIGSPTNPFQNGHFAGNIYLGTWTRTETTLLKLMNDTNYDIKIELREENDNFGADIHYDATNNILKINMMDNGTLREALWVTRSDGKVDIRQGLKVAGTEIITNALNLQNIAAIAQNLRPDADASRNFGSASRRWNKIFCTEFWTLADNIDNGLRIRVGLASSKYGIADDYGHMIAFINEQGTINQAIVLGDSNSASGTILGVSLCTSGSDPTTGDETWTKLLDLKASGDLWIKETVAGKGWKNTNPSLSDEKLNRSLNTWYQNTSGKTLFVCILLNTSGAGDGELIIGPSTSTYYTVDRFLSSDSSLAPVYALKAFVPAGWYYKLDSSDYIDYWYEGYLI